MQGRKVVVTGAGGFVGGHVSRYLAARGHVVRNVLRPGGHAPELPGESVFADVTRAADLSGAMAGADCVVHAAGIDPETIVAGTRAALEAAGGRRLVFLSSVAVYGAGEGIFAEDASPGGPLDAYAAAKVAAETLCRAAGGDLVILRPGIVTGSGSRLWVDDIAARLATGRAGTMGDFGRGWVAPLHWRDLAAAVEAALALPAQPGAPAFNVSGAERLTWNAYFERLARALDLPLRRRTTVGFALRHGVGLGAKLLARAGIGGGAADLPGLSELGLYRRRATYPTDRLTAATGWRPGMRLDEIFAEIARNGGCG